MMNHIAVSERYECLIVSENTKLRVYHLERLILEVSKDYIEIDIDSEAITNIKLIQFYGKEYVAICGMGGQIRLVNLKDIRKESVHVIKFDNKYKNCMDNSTWSMSFCDGVPPMLVFGSNAKTLCFIDLSSN